MQGLLPISCKVRYTLLNCLENTQLSLKDGDQTYLNAVMSTLVGSRNLQTINAQYSLTSMASIYGLPEITPAHGEETKHIVKYLDKKGAA